MDETNHSAMLNALAFNLGKGIIPLLARPDLIRQSVTESYRQTDTSLEAISEGVDFGSCAEAGSETAEDSEISNLDGLKRTSASYGNPLEPLKLQARVKKVFATYANLRRPNNGGGEQA